MPFECDDVPIVYILYRFVATFISIEVVSGTIEFVDVVSDIFHNVYFSASWPIAIDVVGGHHPESWPCSACLGYFQASLYPAIGPGVFPFGCNAT